MKTLDGKDIKRGHQILAAGDKDFVIMGTVHELYDNVKPPELRVGGYGLRIKAEDTVLAIDAFNAYAAPLLEKRAAEAKAKAEADEAARVASHAPQNTASTSQPAEQGAAPATT